MTGSVDVDVDYEGVSVGVDVDDSDTAGLVVSLETLEIDEDGSGSFMIRTLPVWW